MLIAINDPDDPRVAAYRDIKERDLVGRQGLFVAEGEVVLRVLLRSALFRPVSILIDEKRADALAWLAEADAPIYAASQAVLDQIAGFHLHRGILAIAERLSSLSGSELLDALPDRALVVGLFGISNHDNMGGVFRNAAAFGASAVLLDAHCCDPLYRKAIRVSVGGVLAVPFAKAEGDLVGLLEGHGFDILALSPSGKVPLAEVRRAPRMAALFGTEGEGLSDMVLSRVRTARIPMAAGFDSLNVATTSGIVLAHLA